MTEAEAPGRLTDAALNVLVDVPSAVEGPVARLEVGAQEVVKFGGGGGALKAVLRWR